MADGVDVARSFSQAREKAEKAILAPSGTMQERLHAGKAQVVVPLTLATAFSPS